jgi:uncharacterized membrane protein YjdF
VPTVPETTPVRLEAGVPAGVGVGLGAGGDDGVADDGRERSDRRRLLAVAVTATVVLCAISLAGVSVAKYRWSAAFLVPIVWAVFLLRRRLALRPLHFTLLAVALLAHDMGAFGWYQRRVVGLQYDWYVHFLFGVVGGLIVARTLEVRLGVRGLACGLLTVLAVLGMGGVHEIVEAASTLQLGPEHGMLHIGPENPYDTQEDMLNNLLGASLALGLRRIRDLRVMSGRFDPRSAPLTTPPKEGRT